MVVSWSDDSFLEIVDDEIEPGVPAEKEEASVVVPQKTRNSAVQSGEYRATVLESQSELPKTETIDWKSLKSSGMDDLGVASKAPNLPKRQELLSHVPTETVVMKYGYVGPVAVNSV